MASSIVFSTTIVVVVTLSLAEVQINIDTNSMTRV
jgi:hypothetical protein